MAEKMLRSRINEVVRSEEMAWDLIELNRSSIKHGKKAMEFYRILEQNGVRFEQLGIGTNRVGVKINGYCFKYSLNKEGLFDTRREMYLSKLLGKDVVMVHEITSDGTLGVYEYVRTLSSESELKQYYDKIHAMLERITTKYFIGDMGIVTKNSRNIGVRSDGTVCSIDFAYIRSIKSSDVTCPHCRAVYRYNDDFSSVYCNCRNNVKFEELRRYFADDSADLTRIPQQSYIFNGETEKMVELDPAKSIIDIRAEDVMEQERERVKAYREEERWKAFEMLRQYRFRKGES